MKTPIILALSALLASANSSHAAEVTPDVAATATADAPAPLTAMQILEKSRRTYADFSIYKGSCSVVSDVVYAEGDAAPKQTISSASAQIEFERGKSFSAAGVDAGGNRFKALWTPGESSIEQVRRGDTLAAGKAERTDYKNEPNISALDSILGGLSGMTQGTGSTVFAALQDHVWSSPFPLPKSQLRLLPARNLGATLCYVFVATNAESNSVNTYWIEQKTFLLRRLTQELGEQRYDDLPVRNGVEEPIMRVAYSTEQYVFATTEAK